jgi:hypothetical protein
MSARRFKLGTLWFESIGKGAWQHIGTELNITVYKRGPRRWSACENVTNVATRGCPSRKVALRTLAGALMRDACALRDRANALKDVLLHARGP